ncbi:PDDEXK nuclease domain-containing protein [Rhodococcus globerulus]|uniref:PDDEXK nuclease domain-containing protein n=1 Tax=Rhodococcus globerulus TaxID=33008 RepID=UPI00374F9BEC
MATRSPRLASLASELGAGFTFVGGQYKITAGEHENFLDLLFFHPGLRRFVVFELKVGQAEPEHIGKLNVYINVVDDQLRKPDHGEGATIGILLVATRDDIVVDDLHSQCRGDRFTASSEHVHHIPATARRHPPSPTDRRRSRTRPPRCVSRVEFAITYLAALQPHSTL